MSFAFAQSPCRYDEVYFELALLTDDKAEETSWSLKDASSGEQLMQGNNYQDFAHVEETMCLASNECHLFTIADIGGDGICCEQVGMFVVRVNGLSVASGGSFGFKDELYIGCDAPTSSPTKIPSAIPSSFPSSQPTRYGNCNDDETVLEVIVK